MFDIDTSTTKEEQIGIWFTKSQLIALADNMMYAADMAENTMPCLAKNLRKKAKDFYNAAGIWEEKND